ncbi:MAG: hypothetical protein IJ652_02030 [Bacteroidales bacterium]|nr:hypothetical protein [Bacteroidales bacterium]
MDTNYGLNPAATALLEEYREKLPMYGYLAQTVPAMLKQRLDEAGIVVAAIEHRVKAEASLAGKLALKGDKYHSILDVTDIVGLRVITFYMDDVDKVAAIIDRMFDIDWENSVDKRKAHQIDSFGYMSLHFICRLPKKAVPKAEYAGLEEVRFEIQIRTVLQHAWANMNHDTGYKSGVEVPSEYLRSLSRLAGILELVDGEFSRIRSELADYRRNIQALVASGNLDEVPLDGDSFRSYLSMRPFDALNRRIAAVNQAEIQDVSLDRFLPLFKTMGFQTLGDIANLIRDYAEAAFQIACYQIGLTDLDIVSASIGPQDLCMAYILKAGGGKLGLRTMLDQLNGPSQVNEMMAGILYEQASDMPFMHQNT